METVSDYVLRRRLEECGRQLADVLWRQRTITEIAFGWGFNNATHFARVFRNHYGTNPARLPQQPHPIRCERSRPVAAARRGLIGKHHARI
ncbi:MAG: helix-turn-helix domain-containing protein [Rhizomicrobium sp.]